MSSNPGNIRESRRIQDLFAEGGKSRAPIDYPSRLSPALRRVCRALGTALASPTVLGAVAIGLLCFAGLGNGMQLDPDKALHDWQVRRLMDPSPQELENERMGNVYIYDGLTDREVEAAMDAHFERIQYMMFVGTLKTDASSEAPQGSGSGQFIQESGGCDE